jgi:hypothetical protein
MAKLKVFDGNTERILVLHEEKYGLDGKILSFQWQYGTYFSFACGEDWSGWYLFLSFFMIIWNLHVILNPEETGLDSKLFGERQPFKCF